MSANSSPISTPLAGTPGERRALAHIPGGDPRLDPRSGPLGLFSEAITPTGDQVGNCPQASTHLALINAAIHLEEVLARSQRP